MTRIEVIKKIIQKKNAQNYLEVGVFTGECFLQIKAKRKFAVDPEFRIPWEVRKDNLLKKINRRLFDKFELYFAKYSDDFFNEEKNLLKKYPLDVVFLDGLHTYGQTLKDVENALDYLNNGGVVILHDCNPETETIAYPAGSLNDAKEMNLPGWTGVWSGDVWKTIAHIRTTRADVTAFVLDTDCGLGIVVKKPSAVLDLFDKKDIPGLSYQDLEKNREKILNLKPVSYLEEFLSTL